MTKSEKVRVYRNLTQKCYSAKSKSTNDRVVHVKTLTLVDCKFKVSRAGNERVRRMGQKNVHAFVVGHRTDRTIKVGTMRRVTYNPYENTTFVYSDTKESVHSADMVYMDDTGCFVVEEEKTNG